MAFTSDGLSPEARALADARAVVDETTPGTAALGQLVAYLNGARGLLQGLEPLQEALLGGIESRWSSAVLAARLAQASAEASRLSSDLARLTAEIMRLELEDNWGSPYLRADGQPVEVDEGEATDDD